MLPHLFWRRFCKALVSADNWHITWPHQSCTDLNLPASDILHLVSSFDMVSCCYWRQSWKSVMPQFFFTSMNHSYWNHQTWLGQSVFRNLAKVVRSNVLQNSWNFVLYCRIFSKSISNTFSNLNHAFNAFHRALRLVAIVWSCLSAALFLT